MKMISSIFGNMFNSANPTQQQSNTDSSSSSTIQTTKFYGGGHDTRESTN